MNCTTTLRSVLVVDDEPAIRQLIGTALREKGFQVLFAGGGRDALNCLSREPIDLMIVDLLMPDQEGIETIQRVRQISPDLKILAISGGDPLYLKMARILGAQDTLAKPFALDALVAKVIRIMLP